MAGVPLSQERLHAPEALSNLRVFALAMQLSLHRHHHADRRRLISKLRSSSKPSLKRRGEVYGWMKVGRICFCVMLSALGKKHDEGEGQAQIYPAFPKCPPHFGLLADDTARKAYDAPR
jgi:hypothetical protein